MRSTRETIKTAFALFLVALAVVMWLYSFAPWLQAELSVLDKKIAMYIDTLSTTEQGSISIPVIEGTVKSVEIAYETKGKKEEYKIPDDGWYVIVEYRSGPGYMKSASRIDIYDETAKMDSTIQSPKEICIFKSRARQYAEVGIC